MLPKPPGQPALGLAEASSLRAAGEAPQGQLRIVAQGDLRSAAVAGWGLREGLPQVVLGEEPPLTPPTAAPGGPGLLPTEHPHGDIWGGKRRARPWAGSGGRKDRAPRRAWGRS